MHGFFFIFTVIFVVWVAKAVSRYMKHGRSAWQDAGIDLGLVYAEGGFLSGPRLQGELGGLRVEIDTYTQRSGKSSTTYTRYVVAYPAPLGLNLALSRQGAWSGVAKFFGAQDIKIDDPHFDKSVIVKGNDPIAVRAFLNPDRRYRIHTALGTWPSLHIEDHQVRLEVTGFERSSQRLSGTIRRLVVFVVGLIGEEMPRHPALDGRPSSFIPTAPAPPPPPRFATENQVHPSGLRLRGDDQAQPVPVPEPPPPVPVKPPVLPHATRKPLHERKPREEPTPALAPEPEPAPVSPAPVVPAGPSIGDVCAVLFKPNQSGTDAEKIFKEHFQGQAIHWRAELRSVQRSTFDVVFGNDPMARAVFDTIEVNAGMYGTRRVQVVAQFAENLLPRLQGFDGMTAGFQGKLVRLDGLMRTLYVAGAQLDQA